jgi:uncharacterized membrane protein
LALSDCRCDKDRRLPRRAGHRSLGFTFRLCVATTALTFVEDKQRGEAWLPSALGVGKEQAMRSGTKWLIATLAALAAIVVLVPGVAMGALGMGRMGGGMMGQGMMGGCPMAGSGMSGTCPAMGTGMMADSGWTQGLAMGLAGLATLAMWLAVVAAAVLAIRWLTTRTATDAEPLSILQRRYAAGEIDGITYAEMRAALNA